MSVDYLPVDLSRMLEQPKCAIICRSFSDAQMLFHSAMSQFGDRVFWTPGQLEDLWGLYKENTGFTLFDGSGDEDGPGDLTYCDEDWFRVCGYEIIEFDELSNPVDIEESEMSLNVLLSIGNYQEQESK